MAASSRPHRDIPSVERLLRAPVAASVLARWRRDRVVDTIRLVLRDLRHALDAGGAVPADEVLLARVESRLAAAAAPRLTRVVNATGVVLHTNLGRAPLAEPAIEAVMMAARGAVNLELDVGTGRRGSRDALVADDLRALTGAEDALVVNNNAAAVLLAVAALAAGREVVVSRGELVEIGGSFRMPEVMALSGARLREVGTTNRTHADDYRRALGPDTGLLVKAHTSNYRIVGFTAAVALPELVAIGRAAGVPVLEDLGSGALVDLSTHGLPREPLVRERVAAGADVVTFSGDKLLGGPQAGIVVGRAEVIERLARHPLRRALRPDKLTLAALAATLRLYREAPDLSAVLPVLRWLTRPLPEMDAIGRAVAPRLAAQLGPGHTVTLVDSDAEAGSGALPAAPIPSRALAIEHPTRSPEDLAARFRAGRPPVLGRIHGGRFLLDLRGVFAPEDLLVELDPLDTGMPLIVGTAGHIDHGKTSLVRALTGQDTDRLAEEKARGISIDLGFAWLEGPGGERAGIVDVPGHERFIRNMLAGAHGMDLVLFTVAADDGVMPQTEEHLDILHVLGVRRGIFVITKADLVDPARVEAVREEIEILSLDTTLEDAPVVAVSTVTGLGLDTLRAAIAAELGRASPGERTDGYFRLPVDRAFVMRGHGVVVTGTAMAGRVAPGDTLQLLPRGSTARVRGVEVHGTPVPHAVRGQRIALNLGGMELGDVGRGDVVCDPRIARATTRLDVRVEVRPGARRVLASYGRVRVHLGTAEVLGRVVLLDGAPALEPRRSGWAQLVLRAPVVALRGDRFVLRDETARWTLGGGVVVNPFAERWRRADAGRIGLLERLAGTADDDAVAAFLEASPELAVSIETLAQGLGMTVERARQVVEAMGERLLVLDAGGGSNATVVAPASWSRFASLVLAAVAEHHRGEPQSEGLEMESLRAGLPWPVSPRVFRWGIDRLVEAGRLVRAERLVHLPAHRVALGASARDRAPELESLLTVGGFTPPDVRQLALATGLPARTVLDVLAVMERDTRVVRIAPDLFYARAAADDALARLTAHCHAHGEITAATFRDLIGASRKFAIAFLDWTDRTGVTLRVGDLRRLRR